MRTSMELTDVLMESFAFSLMLPLVSYYTERHVLFPSSTEFTVRLL